MIKSIVAKVFFKIFSKSDGRVKLYIDIMLFLKRHNMMFASYIISHRLQRKYGVFLSPKTKFDSSLILRHPVGIVIGEGAELGKNVTIFQNVTLGRSNAEVVSYPKVGDNTIIYAGAVILGGILIGKNCVVGANAVVTKNVPDDSIAIGMPAKIYPKKPGA